MNNHIHIQIPLFIGEGFGNVLCVPERVSCGLVAWRGWEALRDSGCSRNEWRTGEDWASTANQRESEKSRVEEVLWKGGTGTWDVICISHWSHGSSNPETLERRMWVSACPSTSLRRLAGDSMWSLSCIRSLSAPLKILPVFFFMWTGQIWSVKGMQHKCNASKWCSTVSVCAVFAQSGVMK